MGKRNPSARKKKIAKQKKKNISAMMIVGAGLLLIGVAAMFAIPKNKESESVSDASSSVPVPVNYDAPELTLKNLDGEEESLSDYRGSVVLVNLWATWCPPCKAELPVLEAYYEKHAADGFVIIGIEDGEPPEQVAAFVQGWGLTYPIWTDQTAAGEAAFRVRGLPSSFVIDRNGTVRLAWTGAISDAMLEKYVTPIIEE